MKTPSPKKNEAGAENKEFVRELRLDSSRVRTNLCELPTTYIHNCQTNVPSNNMNEPYKSSNYSSDISKKAATMRNYRCLSPCNMEVPPPPPPGDYCTCVEEKKAFLKYSAITENNIHSALKTKIIQAVKNQPVAISKFNCNCQPTSPKYSANSVTVVRQSKLALCAAVNCVDKSLQDERSEPNPEVTSDNAYTSSVLEPRRHRVRQRSESDNNLNEPVNETREITLCTVMSKKAREVSPLENKKDLLRSKNIVKVASIKNRHKINVIKLRKVRSKIAHSVSSDSNFSDSDYSEAEEEEKLESTEIFKQDIGVEQQQQQQNVNSKAGCTPTNTCVPGKHIRC